VFHPAKLGAACADMHVYDIDGDGKMDVLSSSAHNFGIWCHQQRVGKDGKSAFVEQVLFKDLVSQTHALACLDLNGDGLKDFITGRRWWAHGPKGDAGADGPGVLYWFEAKKAADGMIGFTPHLIDNDSGVGTQFWTGDLNGDGLPDIVVANKKGVHAYLQIRN
jgi:FG-GAP-like repeat/FG-GAP repeat